MEGANLCLDVLAIVCEFLTDVSDVLSFILTTSSLRPIATRWLLSMGPIHVAGSESMRQSHSFLFADAPARTPYIRALDITNTRPEIRGILAQPKDASILIELLTSCPHLDLLSFTFENDDFSNSPRIMDDPQIVNAIAGIPNLRIRSLSIRGWDTDAYTLLHAAQPLLQILCLHTYHIQTGNEETDF